LPPKAKPAISSVSRWPQVTHRSATAAVGAVAELGNHALKSDVAGALEQIQPVDVKASAELDSLSSRIGLAAFASLEI
jgi:hypothetical protein